MQFQRGGKEWIDPRLAEEIAKLSWPIAFLDFETTMAAIPWHAGLKPYETLPFQFSAHILYEDGRFEHREWLNTEDRVPTLPFIRNLRSSLDSMGSVLVYTNYENRILSEAIGLLNRLHHEESKEEREWIVELLDSGRIVDQHDWVYHYYFHPQMAGRTSIKMVLPSDVGRPARKPKKLSPPYSVTMSHSIPQVSGSFSSIGGSIFPVELESKKQVEVPFHLKLEYPLGLPWFPRLAA